MSELEGGLQCLSVDMDAFATSTACCDVGFWPPKSIWVSNRG